MSEVESLSDDRLAKLRYRVCEFPHSIEYHVHVDEVAQLFANLDEAEAYRDREILACNELAKKCDALQAIVDKLPKYEDGGPILPDSIGYRIRIYRGHTPPIKKVHECDMQMISEHGAYGEDDAYMTGEPFMLGRIWSTREAAEAAKEAQP